jgi:hypothetical protein
MTRRRKKMRFGESSKYLYEWIEERKSFDEYHRFLDFCQQEGYSATDMVSETDFLVLEEKYEA